MNIKIRKNGSIKMTAKSKRDSLNLLKLMYSMTNSKDLEMEELIKKKEKECEEFENQHKTNQI